MRNYAREVQSFQPVLPYKKPNRATVMVNYSMCRIFLCPPTTKTNLVFGINRHSTHCMAGASLRKFDLGEYRTQDFLIWITLIFPALLAPIIFWARVKSKGEVDLDKM